jgi:hypothetical protein
MNKTLKHIFILILFGVAGFGLLGYIQVMNIILKQVIELKMVYRIQTGIFFLIVSWYIIVKFVNLPEKVVKYIEEMMKNG